MLNILSDVPIGRLTSDELTYLLRWEAAQVRFWMATASDCYCRPARMAKLSFCL